MNYLECAKTAITDLEINATDDQIEQLAIYFEQDVENNADIDSIQFEAAKSDRCKCEYYKSEIERLEEIISVYNDSVKERRNCNKVWVDTNNRTVHYE